MIRTKPTSTRKAKGHGPERRAEILDHAMRLIGEHGVQTVSTRQIANAVGISQPSLYAYFPNRQALIEAVCVQAFERLILIMTQVAQTSTGLDRLKRLGRAYLMFGFEQPDAYRVGFIIETQGPFDPTQIEPPLLAGLRAYGLHRQALAEHLGDSRTPDEIDRLAQSLWASLHGLVALMIARAQFPWADREALIETHLERLLTGL